MNKRLSTLLIYGLLYTFIFSFNFVLVGDPDFGWHLRYGEEVVVSKRVLTVDTFSHTFIGQGIIDTEWLTEAGYYLIFNKYSFLGLALISAIFTSLAFFVPAIVQKGSLSTKLIITCWAVLGSASVLSIGARPQNVSFVLFSLVFVLLLKYVETNKSFFLVGVPLLFLIWSNAHPGYVLGLFLIFIFLLFEIIHLTLSFIKRTKKTVQLYFASQVSLIKMLFAVFFLACLFTTFKPYSYHDSGFSLDLVKALALPINVANQVSSTASVRSAISEWLPPILINLPGTLFILAIIYSIALFVDRRIGKSDIRNLFLISGFIYFSTLSRRNVPFFFLVFIPIVIPYTEKIISQTKIKMILPYFTFLVVGLIMLISVPRILKERKKILTQGASISSYCQALGYPCEAIEFIKNQKMSGKMFNHYNWGGYLIWNLPEYPTFIDGRVPGGKVFSEFETVISLKKGWQTILKKYGVRWMLVPRNQQFEKLVKIEGNWEVAFVDERAVVLQIIN